MPTPIQHFPQRLIILVVAVAALIGSSTTVPAAEHEVLVLKEGDRILGTSLGVNDGYLLWQMSQGQVMEVPIEFVERLEFPSDEDLKSSASNRNLDPLTADGTASLVEPGSPVEPTDVVDPLIPRPFSFGGMADSMENRAQRALTFMEGWTKRIELGGQFIDGNAEQDLFNGGLTFENQNERRSVLFEGSGQWGRADGIPTTNRWVGNGTVDFCRAGNWISFMTSKNEYDEFENLNWRGTFAGGLGYRFHNEDDKRCIVRVGPSVTHEIFTDPRNERTTPDMLGEYEVLWPLYDRMRFEHKMTITPSVEDIELFRFVSTYGISLSLDEDARWNLKLGTRHEYNSEPNDERERSDYTTNLSIVYARR